MNYEASEIQKLQKFLQSKLNTKLTLKGRPNAGDSVELLIDGEYLGTVYKDDEDGDISYNVNLSVLAMDLDEVA